MNFKTTFWICAAGNVGWSNHKDGLIVMPVFSSQKSFDIIDAEIKKMDENQLIFTVVESPDEHYSIICYEDPRDKLVPDFGFLIMGMNSLGNYSNFKEDYNYKSKIYFSYATQNLELVDKYSNTGIIKPLIEPFLIKSFRIINDLELKLTEFTKQNLSEYLSPNNFEYYNEATGIMTLMRK